MTDLQAAPQDAAQGATSAPDTDEEQTLVDDGLVEEISIDGMCGVY